MIKKLILTGLLFVSCSLFAQIDGDVIINEVGNHGTKKDLYTGGDYIELVVLKDEGVKLAGWYLTDLSSTTGTAKETEGAIKFSDKDNSVFNHVLPKGTYILICFGNASDSYGGEKFNEMTDFKNGDNKIVVFTESSGKHIEKASGTMDLAGKDNLALLSIWNKHSAVDIVTWEGTSSWDGAEVSTLPLDMVANGKIIYFKHDSKNFQNNTSVASWTSASNVDEATPGKTNKDVDDSSLKAK